MVFQAKEPHKISFNKKDLVIKLIYNHMVELEHKLQGKNIELYRVQKPAWEYLKQCYVLLMNLPIDKESISKAELEDFVVTNWLLSQ